MIRCLLLALAAVGLCLGQDTTCNAGDILWVSETVTADTDVAAGGATYNNSATPWGIQGAFDGDCNGAIIRILAGANNYGPSSNSWTNRDDSTKEINVKGDRDGAISQYVKVEGWHDSSTRCGTSGNRWTATCPVYLDFDRNNITGANGFDLGTAGADGYIFEWIGVTNVDAAGWSFSTGALNSMFTSVAAVNVTGSAFTNINPNTAGFIYNAYLSNVGTGGSAAIIASGHHMTIMSSVIDCAPGGSPAAGQVGIQTVFNQEAPVIVNNVFRNCISGVDLINQAHFPRIIRNTFNNNTTACIHAQSNAERIIAVGNVFYDCPESIKDGLVILLAAQNAYSGSLNQADDVDRIYSDPDGAFTNGAPTFSGLSCAFVGALDESLASGCAIDYTPPGGQLSSQDAFIPGVAIKMLGAGGGGGGGGEFSYVSVQ